LSSSTRLLAAVAEGFDDPERRAVAAAGSPFEERGDSRRCRVICCSVREATSGRNAVADSSSSGAHGAGTSVSSASSGSPGSGARRRGWRPLPPSSNRSGILSRRRGPSAAASRIPRASSRTARRPGGNAGSEASAPRRRPSGEESRRNAGEAGQDLRGKVAARRGDQLADQGAAC
jgi:hypothetical protein